LSKNTRAPGEVLAGSHQHALVERVRERLLARGGGERRTRPGALDGTCFFAYIEYAMNTPTATTGRGQDADDDPAG
jgi:hypothetical protein